MAPLKGLAKVSTYVYYNGTDLQNSHVVLDGCVSRTSSLRCALSLDLRFSHNSKHSVFYLRTDYELNLGP